MMYEQFADFLANCELRWLDPADTGDLTAAPMLGITGEPQHENDGPFGAILVGHWDNKDWYEPIEKRWAFMDYQLRSVLDDLVDQGRAQFVSSS